MPKSAKQRNILSAGSLREDAHGVLAPFTIPMSSREKLFRGLVFAGLLTFCLIYGFLYALTTPFLLTQFLAPLLLLSALVIWALPDMKIAPTRTLEILFFAFFVAAAIWPNYLAVALPGLPWITSVRLIGLPLALLLTICVSISPDFRSWVRYSATSIPLLLTFVVGFIIVQCTSVLISDKHIESLNAVFAYQISWTAIFFTACYVFLRPGNAEKWAFIFCGSASFICLLGLWEQQLERVPWSGHIPSFLAVGDEYVQRVLSGARRLGTGKYRVQTIHSTPLGCSEFLALVTPFAIHFAVGSYGRAVRAWAALSLPLIFYVILATDSRLGVVGFFLSCLLYLLAWGVMSWRTRGRSLVAPAVVLAYPALAVAFLTATFTVQRLKSIVWGSGGTAYSDQGRIDQLIAGIPKVLMRPWGYGASRGAEELGYTNLAGTMTIDNYFLLIALDYGILGFIFYYGAILIAVWSSVKYGIMKIGATREHRLIVPVGISLLVFFVIKTIFSQPTNHTIQFMLMGLAAALVFRIKNGDAAGLPRLIKD